MKLDILNAALMDSLSSYSDAKCSDINETNFDNTMANNICVRKSRGVVKSQFWRDTR